MKADTSTLKAMAANLPTVTLWVATSNPGKLRDFAAASSHSHFLLRPLPGLEAIPPPVEDADTFAGNAILKALAYSRHAPGAIVLADDSGLEVDALHGAPGIYSARHAAHAHFPNPTDLPTDALNNAYLIRQLTGIPAERRSARYRCVLAAACDGSLLETNGTPALGHGTAEGFILTEPRGTAGFGYDPLFFLPERDQTMAEINLEGKLKLSHRGRALANLLNQLT